MDPRRNTDAVDSDEDHWQQAEDEDDARDSDFGTHASDMVLRHAFGIASADDLEVELAADEIKKVRGDHDADDEKEIAQIKRLAGIQGEEQL